MHALGIRDNAPSRCIIRNLRGSARREVVEIAVAKLKLPLPWFTIAGLAGFIKKSIIVTSILSTLHSQAQRRPRVMQIAVAALFQVGMPPMPWFTIAHRGSTKKSITVCSILRPPLTSTKTTSSRAHCSRNLFQAGIAPSLVHNAYGRPAAMARWILREVDQ